MMKLIKEILILTVGVLIFTTFGVVGVVYTFFKHTYKLDYSLSKQLSPIIRSITLLFDGFANSSGGELINDVLKIKGQVQYGNWYQTISAVTGILYLKNTDTKLRIVLDKILGKNHCVQAISKEDRHYYIKQ